MNILLDLLTEYEIIMDKEDIEKRDRVTILIQLAKNRFECLKEVYQTRIIKPGFWGADVKRKELDIEYCTTYGNSIDIRITLVHRPETRINDERFSFCSYSKEILEDDEKFKKEVEYYAKKLAREAKDHGCRKVKGK